MEGDGVIDPGTEYIPPPSGPMRLIRRRVRTPEQIKQEVESEEEKAERLEGGVAGPGNAHTSLQAQEKRKAQLKQKDAKSGRPVLMSASIYEEKLLLRNLEACPNAVAMTPNARRLRRKLIVRQSKRERGLPLFDLDSIVNAALLLVNGIYGAKEGSVGCPAAGHATYRTTSQDFRILDRYQVNISRCSPLWDGGRCVCKGEQRYSKAFQHSSKQSSFEGNLPVLVQFP